MGNPIKEEQGMYVVKHNDLIKARYNLTTQQQKIILYAISKIKPTDKLGTWYELSIEDLCKTCGLIMDDTGYYYKSIKEDLQKLTNRLWIKMPDKKEMTISWIGDAIIVPLSGTIHIKFHEAIQEYLFLLSEHYTQYKLESVLAFNNKYSIRLFELLKMQVKQSRIEKGWEEQIKYSIQELRDLLAVEGYSRWAEFKRNIIDKAVNEINTYSDIFRISCEFQKNGKNIETIVFIVSQPTETEKYIAHQEARERLKLQRKPSKKTIEKQEKARKLSERRKEIETRLSLNPSFEELQESNRELLEINKEMEILYQGPEEKKKKGVKK